MTKQRIEKLKALIEHPATNTYERQNAQRILAFLTEKKKPAFAGSKYAPYEWKKVEASPQRRAI